MQRAGLWRGSAAWESDMCTRHGAAPLGALLTYDGCAPNKHVVVRYRARRDPFWWAPADLTEVGLKAEHRRAGCHLLQSIVQKTGNQWSGFEINATILQKTF